jgi:hypothetical protein
MFGDPLDRYHDKAVGFIDELNKATGKRTYTEALAVKNELEAKLEPLKRALRETESAAIDKVSSTTEQCCRELRKGLHWKGQLYSVSDLRKDVNSVIDEYEAKVDPIKAAISAIKTSPDFTVDDEQRVQSLSRWLRGVAGCKKLSDHIKDNLNEFAFEMVRRGVHRFHLNLTGIKYATISIGCAAPYFNKEVVLVKDTGDVYPNEARARKDSLPLCTISALDHLLTDFNN